MLSISAESNTSILVLMLFIGHLVYEKPAEQLPYVYFCDR